MAISSSAHEIPAAMIRILRIAWGAVVKLYLRSIGVKLGQGLRIYSFPICRIHSGAEISLGSDVWINNKTTENLAGLAHPTILVASRPGAAIKIGNNVGISGAILFCCSQIVVEDHVNIGAGVRVYDTDFHAVSWIERREHRPEAIPTKPVRICHDVWIGANAMVLKGVTIGARSVIAAGAIVTSDIPPDCIAGGVPAKVLRPLSEEEISPQREACPVVFPQSQ